MRSLGNVADLSAEQASIARELRLSRAQTFPLPDPTKPAGTDLLPEIHHIVVLMMENHSYDNYLGMLDRGEGFPKAPDGRPTVTNPSGTNAPVPTTPRGSTAQERGLPSQSWHGSHVQCDGGKNDGFIKSSQALLREMQPPFPDETIAMQYWTDQDLPFYCSLARTFPLMDRWFSSCLGPTFPNRRFLIAGTAHGLIDDVVTGLFDYPQGGTIFDRLTLAGIEWSNYHHRTRLFAARDAAAKVAGKPGVQAIRALGLFAAQLPGLRGYLSGAGGLHEYLMGRMQFTANLYPVRRTSRRHIKPLEDFFRDAEEGTLPPVAIVDPDFGAFSEESPQDISAGEAFAASVVKAVMHGPGWPHTLMIWTYDEHGGYYDHVPPPEAVPPDDVLGHSLLNTLGAFDWLLRRFSLWRKLKEANDDRVGTKLEPRVYNRLGFRVPTVIVSPFAKADYVSSRDGPVDGPPGGTGPRAYDHTSILKTIEGKWNLAPLTRRDAAAPDVLDALDFENPAFLTPPRLDDPTAWATLA